VQETAPVVKNTAVGSEVKFSAPVKKTKADDETNG
jgi:hypothetical protein